MRSTTPRTSEAAARPRPGPCGLALVAAGLALLVPGCAYVVNRYREDGPSTSLAWDSPSAQDVQARFAAAPPRDRGWPPRRVALESGTVVHWPLYFEDPFEDRGRAALHADDWSEPDPRNVRRIGWEDWLALPYGIARFTANWLLLPASAVVTPPWTLMESDGRISRQLVWSDHDAAAAPAGRAPAPP